MPASKKEYVCSSCGRVEPKWLGKCPDCGEWNTFEERIVQPKAATSSTGFQNKTLESVSDSKSTATSSKPYQLSELFENLDAHPRAQKYPFSADILNSFWGGGLTAGSLTLLAGEPGNGKSTFSLQLLRSLSVKNPQTKLLYITAEESVFELARRSRRLKIPKHISVLQSNNYEHIENIIETSKPEVVIIDSIQTIFSSFIPSSPGSVAQVSKLSSQFLALSKSLNISVVIIGHVTKEGQIAGPKTLEHLVDSVLTLENSEHAAYRTLSFSKHRFGTTDSMLLLKMEESGLEIVTDPSLALLENLEDGVGVVYSMALNRDLPMVVEIQALVSVQNSPNGYGRKEALGMSTSKLNTIIAIAEKFLNVSLKPHDVYVQLLGLPKNVYDDSLDMAVLLAILSSLFHEGAGQLLRRIGTTSATASIAQSTAKSSSQKSGKPKHIYAGRLTLSGNIRAATNAEKREQTAQQLGFEFNSGISAGKISDQFVGLG